MTVHAYFDESVRGNTYLLCAVTIGPAHLTPTRKRLAQLLLPGQRELHFKRERPQRQRLLADQIARLPVDALVYRTAITARSDEVGRQRCLEAAIEELRGRCVRRMVFDTREGRDRHDKATINRVLGEHRLATGVTHEHVVSQHEPLVWIADAVAWCYGADSDWRRRVLPLIDKVIDV